MTNERAVLGAGMYEISPYATFSVLGNNSRSVTTSTLDYTMQFKTFGHIENEEHNDVYPKIGDKRSWQKHRYNTGEEMTGVITTHLYLSQPLVNMTLLCRPQPSNTSILMQMEHEISPKNKQITSDRHK